MSKRVTLLLLLIAMGCSNGFAAQKAAKAVAMPAAASPVDNPGEPVLEEPTLHCLGAYWIVAGDDQKQFRIDMAYRKSGDQPWRQSMPMFRVQKGDTTQNNAHRAQLNPAADAWLFAGSIVNLAPDTEYELKLTLVKPAGPPLERTFRARTAAEPVDPADLRVCHVAPGNGGGEGSEQSPYRGLQFAQTQARPGTLLLVHKGQYQGTFRVERSGAEGRPIVWRGAGDGEAIVDANDHYCIYVDKVHDVRFEGLSMRHAYMGMAVCDSSRIVVRRCRASSVKCGIYCICRDEEIPPRKIFIADNDLDGPFPWGGPMGGVEEWRGIQVAGVGYDVCYNRVRGFKDGIDTFPSKYCCSIDFHHNEVLDCRDDGTEMDFSERNNRCFLNRYTNVHQGISEQPIYGGPVYIFRNTIYNIHVEPFKLHHCGHVGQPGDVWPSGAILYNNTVVKKDDPSILYTPQFVHNCVYRNNLFVGGGQFAMEFHPPMLDCDFDYDAFGGGPWKTFMTWNKVQYPTLADVKARAPVERHAVMVDAAKLFAAGVPLPTSVATRYEPADLRLAPGSAAVGAAEVLPGFNDDFPGKAPSVGAYELGSELPHYGPRAEK